MIPIVASMTFVCVANATAQRIHAAADKPAMSGKWHLGSFEGRFPTDQGYYERVGIPRSADEAGSQINPDYPEDMGLESRAVLDRMVVDRTRGYLADRSEGARRP